MYVRVYKPNENVYTFSLHILHLNVSFVTNKFLFTKKKADSCVINCIRQWEFWQVNKCVAVRQSFVMFRLSRDFYIDVHPLYSDYVLWTLAGTTFSLILPGMPITGVISFSYLEYFYYILAEARRMRKGAAKTKKVGGRIVGFRDLPGYAHDITRAIMISGCID